MRGWDYVDSSTFVASSGSDKRLRRIRYAKMKADGPGPFIRADGPKLWRAVSMRMGSVEPRRRSRWVTSRPLTLGIRQSRISDLVLVGGEVAQRQFTDASTADTVKKGWSLVTVA